MCVMFSHKKGICLLDFRGCHSASMPKQIRLQEEIFLWAPTAKHQNKKMSKMGKHPCLLLDRSCVSI